MEDSSKDSELSKEGIETKAGIEGASEQTKGDVEMMKLEEGLSLSTCQNSNKNKKVRETKNACEISSNSTLLNFEEARRLMSYKDKLLGFNGASQEEDEENFTMEDEEQLMEDDKIEGNFGEADVEDDPSCLTIPISKEELIVSFILCFDEINSF